MKKRLYLMAVLIQKNGKYYVNIVVPPKAKEFAVKNGYRITIGEEIMH